MNNAGFLVYTISVRLLLGLYGSSEVSYWLFLRKKE